MRAKAGLRSLEPENEEQRARILELEETLRAIRSGEVDALVVETDGGDQVFTLKGADQTYRLMVEEMQKGAVTLSEDGVVLYCNPFLASLLDTRLEAILGMPLSRFMDEPAALSLSGLLLAAEHGVSRGELSFRGTAGAVPTGVSVTPLPLGGARVFCMIVTDLTERKRQEEARAQLERAQIAQALAEEANRALEEEIERRKGVEAALRQADRLKDEFLATLSHELRTPLNAIVAWAHLIGEPGVDEATVSRAVGAIDRNARAQAQLVADILDVSRIVTGNFHINPTLVRLSDVIESAAETVQPAAHAKDIRLDLPITPVGPVSGDAGRLQQVVWNLLSNAIKFTPAGGLVQLRLQETSSCIELTVTDDGPGIDPDFLPYVFERFRQADSSSTRRHAGLGLGLAIVRHLVELHGGTVEARNREHRSGAVIIVRLPKQQRAAADAAPAPKPAFSHGREQGLPISLQDVSVLLVDDDEDSREALAISLTRLGARVLTAASASEALDVLARDHPQVLVADIAMAGENGYALLQKLRALPAELGGATPAIALTAYANEQDRVDALWAGFQVHVSKPVTLAELAAAVSSLVVRPEPR